MFDWYKNSQICYAYLSDVPTAMENLYNPGSSFRSSKWFTRGWTLQELISPKHVEFLDRDWVEIGTKKNLKDLVESITGITHLFSWNKASVAQKMSWSSRRETTRLEDRAYSLMGLFDINMPLLYGEGSKAFLRLQLEILNRIDDDTIFAWYGENRKDNWGSRECPGGGGLLAPSPEMFRDSQDIIVRKFDHQRTSPSMTARGLRLELYLLPTTTLSGFTGQHFLAPINCTWMPESEYKKLDDFAVVYPWVSNPNSKFPIPHDYTIALHLFSDHQSDEPSNYRRLSALCPVKITSDTLSQLRTSIHVSQTRPFNNRPRPRSTSKIMIKYQSLLEAGFIVIERYSVDGTTKWATNQIESEIVRLGYEHIRPLFLVFSKAGYSELLVLVVFRPTMQDELNTEGSEDVGIRLVKAEEPWREVVDVLVTYPVAGNDRVAVEMQDGIMIHATLKRSIIKEELGLAISIVLASNGRKQWSGPDEKKEFLEYSYV